MIVKDFNQQYPDKENWPIFQTPVTPLTPDNKHTFEIDCEIPANLSFFKGHFPDQPVLPGVVQVNWAYDIAQRVFDYIEFRGVNSLKFNTMILPEAKARLSLTLNPDKHTVKFSYKDADTLFSSGTLVFSSL